MDEDKVAESAEAEQDQAAGKGLDYNLIFMCVVSLLIGFAVKTEFTKRYTMGFNDGETVSGYQSINLNSLEKDVLAKQAAAQAEAQADGQSADQQNQGGAVAEGAACGQ